MTSAMNPGRVAVGRAGDQIPPPAPAEPVKLRAAVCPVPHIRAGRHVVRAQNPQEPRPSAQGRSAGTQSEETTLSGDDSPAAGPWKRASDFVGEERLGVDECTLDASSRLTGSLFEKAK
jgi:hypothetical protein